MKGLIWAAAIYAALSSATALGHELATIPSDSIAKSLAAEATKLAAAQTADDVRNRTAWTRVEALKHGDEIVIQRMDFSSVYGRVVSADATSLVVRNGARVHSIRSVDVYSVRMARSNGSPVGAAIGTAAGTLVGFLVMTKWDWGECRCGSSLIVFPVGLGAGFGILGYHAVPHEPKLIYFRARP
jgi:hypothetical protein